LNQGAARLAVEFGLRGGTDITGYSLLGHSCEMAQSANVRVQFSLARVPFLPGARKYAEQWIFPGGAADNRLHFSPCVRFDPAIGEMEQMLLFDPQTSGGLLLSVPPEILDTFLARAKEMDQPAWVIGEVFAGDSGVEVVA
ncbi:MAG: selenide, water dikinase SelD, partial [Chloroflexi bacterium]